MKNVRKILAPTDNSAASLAGVQYALDIAQREGAEVTLFNVADMLEGMPRQAGLETKFKTPQDVLEEHEKRTSAFLTSHFPDLAQQVKVQIATDLGAPHQRILDKAEEVGIDLIVMSTHGRSGVGRLFLGSITEQVVRHAVCPVLTIRPQAKAA